MIPQHFDPLMDLGTAKTVGGDQPVQATPPENGGPSVVERFDPTANFGTNGSDILIGGDTRPTASDGIQRQPADVDRFSGGSV